VRLVTPLTDDLPGRCQRDELLAAGVDLGLSPEYFGHQSAKAVILVHPETEERTIYWSRGDLPHISANEVDPAWLDQTDLLYLDGHEPEAALALAPQARRLGLPVVLDAGTVRTGSHQLVSICSDVMGSRRFAPDLTGEEDPFAALQLLKEMGPSRVGMTFGKGGVLGLDDEAPVAIPAYDVPVVDTTGAGDAFHAGYALALAHGQDFPTCLRWGAGVAALKCRSWGGRQALPDLPGLTAFLAQASIRPLAPALEPFAI
jgi:ribokinase